MCPQIDVVVGPGEHRAVGHRPAAPTIACPRGASGTTGGAEFREDKTRTHMTLVWNEKMG